MAFALLHGPFGEDGTIQGMFEMMGTRYVGAGVLASAVGMDKIYMKLVLAASGLPIGPFVPVLPREWARDRAACLEAVAALHHPLYVKPARGGSSLGITRVADGEDLVAAIEHAQQFDPKVIIEEGFVDARELECGVLGGLDGADPEASQVAEIRVHSESGFYDFEAKYLPEEQVDLDVPAACRSRDRRGGPSAGGPDLRGHRLRGPGSGRRVRDPGPQGARQRDQHHAGIHGALDVPADVGGRWDGLSRAGGSAAAAGAGTSCRSALSS